MKLISISESKRQFFFELCSKNSTFQALQQKRFSDTQSFSNKKAKEINLRLASSESFNTLNDHVS